MKLRRSVGPGDFKNWVESQPITTDESLWLAIPRGDWAMRVATEKLGNMDPSVCKAVDALCDYALQRYFWQPDAHLLLAKAQGVLDCARQGDDAKARQAHIRLEDAVMLAGNKPEHVRGCLFISSARRCLLGRRELNELIAYLAAGTAVDTDRDPTLHGRRRWETANIVRQYITWAHLEKAL